MVCMADIVPKRCALNVAFPASEGEEESEETQEGSSGDQPMQDAQQSEA